MPTDQHDISHLNGHQFEGLVEQLVKKMGFIVEERKLTADGGIDILAKRHEPILGGIYVIQCKRYTHKVGEPVIRDLYGTVHSKNANKGILITNSTFTKKAIEFAQNKQLELIDGVKLRSLLSKYAIVQPNKETIVLTDSFRFLINSFVPALRKIQDQVEDIKNKRVYVEKTIFNLKQWINFLETKLERLRSYVTFTRNIMNHSFARVGFVTIAHARYGSGARIKQSLGTSPLKELNMQQISNTCKKIIDATKKIVNDYKSLFGIVPPKECSLIHEKFIEFYTSVFNTLFRLADDIEYVEKATVDEIIEKATVDEQRAYRTYRISAVFNIEKEAEEFEKAIKEAEEALKESHSQKSWWQ